LTYEEHEVFDTPPDGTKVWRYMDLPKFVSLLAKQALFFSRADRLGDPYEGSLTTPTRQALGGVFDTVKLHSVTANATSNAGEDYFQEVMKVLPSHVLVSCWYAAERESPAMWGQYAQGLYGIAVQTTVADLRDHLITGRSVYIGAVRYIDYETATMPIGDALWPFIHKRDSFSHEKEVRLIISDMSPHGATPGRTTLGPPEFDSGMYVEAQVDRLIHQVLVAPTSPTWFWEAVAACTVRFGVTVPVQQSEFGRAPRRDLR
jgi:hypothetical protein